MGRDPDPEALLRRNLAGSDEGGAAAGAATRVGTGSARPDTVAPGQ